MARIGKIARLPETVREQLNKRLRNGELGPQLLPWLNSLPEVQAVLTEFFGRGEISPQNLSDWRNGGYRDWDEKQDRHYQRLERTRELAGMSIKLATAGGGNLSEGAAAILGGSILEVLEELDQMREMEGPEGDDSKKDKLEAAAKAISSMTEAVARLRAGDQNREKLVLDRQRLDQAAQALALDREKFEMLASERMLDEALRRKAEEISNSNLSNADKIAAMRQAAFADVDALEQSGEVKIPQ
jgi:hypothetical protein